MNSGKLILFLLSFLPLLPSQSFAKVDLQLFDKTAKTLRSRTSSQCNDDLFSKISISGQIRISIIFGYNDQRPYVNVLDSIEKDTLAAGLQKPCATTQDRLCGFNLNENQLLSKTVRGENGKRVDLHIRLHSSSVSQNDDWNRSTGLNRQNDKSASTKATFSKALENSDVVFYLGHARNGGGPDFFPPDLKENRQVDYTKYKSNKDGLEAVLDGLRSTRNLKTLGLFACNSYNLFAANLVDTRKDISYILAGDISVPSIMNPSMWAALDSLLGKTCDTDLKKSLSTIATQNSNHKFHYIK